MTAPRRSRLERVRYYVGRAANAPLRFLVMKAVIESGKFALHPAFAAFSRTEIRPKSEVSPTFLEFAEALRSCIAETHRSSRPYREQVARRRAELTAGTFPCLGYGTVPIPHGHQWRSDVVSHFEWPDSYFHRIDFVAAGVDSDVKVPWELSRLQWLVWTAEAVCLSEGSDRASWIAFFEQRLQDWEQNNRFGYGPNWTCAMEVAIRAINLAIASAIAWRDLSRVCRARVIRMLSDHRAYLRLFPEISDVSGNHYLFDLCGRLFLEAIVFASPLARGVAAGLVQEAARQFPEDGMHLEYAITYHRYCVEALCIALAVSRRIHLAEASAIEERLDSAIEALRAFRSPNGELPVLGDNDSGQVILLSVAARSTNYLSELTGERGGDLPLLAVLSGEERLRSATIENPSRPRCIVRVGPFVTAQCDDVSIFVRAGRHGLHGRAAHDHDDNLSPWLAIAGSDVLVDQGCHSYTRSRAERSSDISSAAHNLVLIGGRSRFPATEGSIGATARLAPVGSVLETSEDNEGFTIALATNWNDLRAGSVEHRRTLIVRRAARPFPGWQIDCVDEVVSERADELTVLWHFAPDWTVSIHDGAAEFEHPQLRCALEVSSTSANPPTFACATYRFAPVYGSAVAATLVRVTIAPSRSVTTIRTSLLVERRDG